MRHNPAGLKNRLVVPMERGKVPNVPMASAANIVHRFDARTALTQAARDFGLQCSSLPMCPRVSIWVKLTHAGCLA